MKRILCCALAALFTGTEAYAQLTQAWALVYNGPANGDDQGYRVVVNNAGFIFTTGPSVGVGTQSDFLIIKYTSSGDTVWSRRYNGAFNATDIPEDIAADSADNVFVTGFTSGGSTGTDFLTVKYSANGTFQWARTFSYPGNGSRTDVATAVVVGRSGNVYVAGYSSTGTTNNTDLVIIKYSSAGDSLWMRFFNSPQSFSAEVPEAMVLDSTENLYITGYAGGPSVGGPNFLTMKCDSSGTILWTRQYNGPDNGFDRGYATAVDHSGDLYATGAVGYGQNVQDIFTIKYTSSGDSVWSVRYNGPASGRDFPYGIVVDGTGNVYVTGSDEAGASLSDFVTIKYNASGVQQWVALYNGPGNAGDIAEAVALDPAGRLIVTGQVFGGASSTDSATIEYNPLTGDTVQVLRYAGAGSSADVPVAMAIDRTSNIYITGFTGVLNSADLITVKYQRGTTGLNESVELHPRTATLFQNYPNPFNPTTRIKFTLSSQERDGVRSPVTLKVYDILGREVRTLVNENLQAGSYEVTFDAAGLASGVYFYRLETGGSSKRSGSYCCADVFMSSNSSPSLPLLLGREGGRGVEFARIRRVILGLRSGHGLCRRRNFW